MGPPREEKETFGRYLTKERTMRGIPLEEISKATKIPLAVLRAIEEENFSRLPAPIYVQGFLRSYSAFTGLDPNEVLLRYEEAAARDDNGKSRKKIAGIPSTPPRKFAVYLALLTALILIFILMTIFTDSRRLRDEAAADARGKAARTQETPSK